MSRTFVFFPFYVVIGAKLLCKPILLCCLNSVQWHIYILNVIPCWGGKPSHSWFQSRNRAQSKSLVRANSSQGAASHPTSRQLRPAAAWNILRKWMGHYQENSNSFASRSPSLKREIPCPRYDSIHVSIHPVWIENGAALDVKYPLREKRAGRECHQEGREGLIVLCLENAKKSHTVQYHPSKPFQLQIKASCPLKLSYSNPRFKNVEEAPFSHHLWHIFPELWKPAG